MKQRNLFADAALLAAIWYVLLASPAQAYWDVNTGTYIIQLIMGFGAAVWISVRQKPFFKWLRKAPKAPVAPIAASSQPTQSDSTDQA